jgi:hypothetical protein
MWIPEVIFCIATNAACMAATAPEQPTEDDCRAYVSQYMIPLILYTVPQVAIMGASCEQAGTPT